MFRTTMVLVGILAVFALSTASAGEDPERGWHDEVLYFVIVDRFADGDSSNNVKVNAKAKGAFHGGDFKGLTERLGELAELGVTALWITPVVKNIDGFVDGVGFPDWGYHGYWADDFTRIDPRFGTEAELKALVDRAHELGMKVLLDIVYNHPGYESSFTRRPDADRWVRTEARGDCGEDAITSCVAGLPDFKTEHPEVAEYLMDAHLSLAKRVGLDGFRLDTVKHVTHEFWQAHRQRVNAQLGEDFFLLGEVWGGDSRVLDPWFKQDEMDAGFDFSFKGSVQGFVQGRGRTIAFAKYLEKRHRVRDGYVLSHYLSSHDVPGALFELNGNKALFKLCVALQFTTLGMPQIYYGEEVGREGGDWPHNRSHMPWGDRDIKPGAGEARDEDMRAWYKRLIAIRHAHEPLRDGDYRILSAEGDLLVFARADADEEVWVALNRGSEAAAVDLAVPELWRDREIVEAVAAEPVTVGDAGVAVKVPARSVRIYVGR